MGWRFRRSVRLAPGVRINLSKGGASLTMGQRGRKVTIGKHGTYTTIGVPGTGLYHTTYDPHRQAWDGAGKRGGERRQLIPPPEGIIADEQRLTLGYLKRLVTPDDEESFVDGCRELVRGKESSALSHLLEALHLADAAWLAGMIALAKRRYGEAAEYLLRATGRERQLGKLFTKYGIVARLGLNVTERIRAFVGPHVRGALLALGEAYQYLDRPEEALACLKRLYKLAPHDPVVRASYIELLTDVAGGDESVLRQAVAVGEGIRNESDVHAAILLYKARALAALGMHEAARDTLTAALRRKKDRSHDLLAALHLERAAAYQALGKRKQASVERERAFALDPDGAPQPAR